MARAPAHVFSIASGIPFARALAEGIIARVGRDPLKLADVQIYVPTRRASRTLREAFASALSGAALGPRIHALGDVDEDDILFDTASDDLELPPAIAPLRRKLLLAQLVQAWAKAARGLPMGLAQAAKHADALASFLDEAFAQHADLKALANLDEGMGAAHWQEVARFLAIVGEQWPLLLTAEGAIEPAIRRDQLLAALAARLEANPPSAPIIAAGSTGSIPATAALLKTISRLEHGAVVLPGLDQYLDDTAWTAIAEDHGHAQYGLRHLLDVLETDRADVQFWAASPQDSPARAAREMFLSETLRPPPTTDSWRALIERGPASIAPGLEGLSLIEAANAREEAQIIAVALREVLETPSATAALVTPDRGLGRRVAGELARWNIAIDDSAGLPLARTQPGSFLALLTLAASERFAPIALLALLKHPLSGGGETRAVFRARVRALERAVLRGLRPAPGLDGLAEAVAKKKTDARFSESEKAELAGFVKRLQIILSPFESMASKPDADLASLAEAHGAAAEALAATDAASGAAELWRGPGGESAAGLMADMLRDGTDIAVENAHQYAELFRDLAEARAVRPPYGLHPRLFILGPLEARLQHFDVTILGGLNEGTWPANAATDPFLSRPMRKTLGLEAPERRVGLAAHDFASLACGPRVLLTRALKQDGAPTTPSRWWLRLNQLAKGLGLADSLKPEQPYIAWARGLDAAKNEKRVLRPAPHPPVAVRPRRLSITEIETWLRDPYAVYARHVLRLRPLDDIDAEPGPRERGTAIHAALEKFLNAFPGDLPDDAADILRAMGEQAFLDAGASPALLALWRPRFSRAARWFLTFERARRLNPYRMEIEKRGELVIPSAQGPFTLIGRADRIDLYGNGDAVIVDYKSGGRIPGKNEVESLINPQLALEAAMVLKGAFAGVSATNIRELLYLQLTGGEPPGRAVARGEDPNGIADRALAQLAAHVARYDNQTQGYLSRFMPHSTSDAGDYDHLARVREWSVLGGSEP